MADTQRVAKFARKLSQKSNRRCHFPNEDMETECPEEPIYKHAQTSTEEHLNPHLAKNLLYILTPAPQKTEKTVQRMYTI